MTPKYTDLSDVYCTAYKLADLIKGGHYSNIFYYEIHEEVDPTGIYNCLEGLEAFQDRSKEYYNIFIEMFTMHGWVDEFPATIHIALKIGDEWFLAKECGFNYYLGSGPTGILKLREACFNKKITAFAFEGNLDDWIKMKFGKPLKLAINRKSADTRQFEKICKVLEQLTPEMQRRSEQFQDLTEDNIRDRILVTLNTHFKGRGHAESKNRKGKTDITIRTRNGLNELIFELKIWKGIKTLKEAIAQLGGYISWHNNYCGIIIFNYNQNFSAVLSEVADFLTEKYNLNIEKSNLTNEFRFNMAHQTDMYKSIATHLVLVNLNSGK